MENINNENVKDVSENDATENVNNEKVTLLHIHSDVGTNATLNFFTKPSYLSKLKKKYTNSKDENTGLKDNESIKFYKKRIVSLFKDLLKGDEPEHCNDELKYICHLFATHSIKYFESIDKQDIIQQEHTIINGEEMTNDIQNDNLDIIETHNVDTIEDANSIMMRKTIEIPSLDNYVQKIQQDSTNSVKKIIPLKLEIDLKNPTLKTKGVKPKGLKKNIKKNDSISETSISETSISETSISETSISEKDLSQ